MTSVHIGPVSRERMIRAWRGCANDSRGPLPRWTAPACRTPWWQDVDILLRRGDLAGAKSALAGAGFVHRQAAGLDMFLDGAEARARDAVAVIFAGERLWPEYQEPAPDVSESGAAAGFTVVSLEALVRMKLTSFRDKDRVHVGDLVGVGVVATLRSSHMAPALATRLRGILDNPESQDARRQDCACT